MMAHGRIKTSPLPAFLKQSKHGANVERGGAASRIELSCSSYIDTYRSDIVRHGYATGSGNDELRTSALIAALYPSR